MKPWDEQVREDHEALESQLRALEAALKIDMEPEDRLVALRWIVRNLRLFLEPHMRKEEEVLFPALERLLGTKTNTVSILKRQHKKLRTRIGHLVKLLQGSEPVDWDKISLASEGFISRFEDHEKTEDRLLLDVLEFSLKPRELKVLTKSLGQAAQVTPAEVL